MATCSFRARFRCSDPQNEKLEKLEDLEELDGGEREREREREREAGRQADRQGWRLCVRVCSCVGADTCTVLAMTVDPNSTDEETYRMLLEGGHKFPPITVSRMHR